MVYSVDLRWRAIVLYVIMGLNIKDVSFLLGISTYSIERWVALFNKTGDVLPKRRTITTTRWPSEVYEFIRDYKNQFPYFYFKKR